VCRTGAIKYRGLDKAKPIEKVIRKEKPKKEKSLKEMTETERRKAGFFTNRGGKIVPINKPEKPKKKKVPAKKTKKKAPKRRVY